MSMPVFGSPNWFSRAAGLPPIDPDEEEVNDEQE